MFEYDLKNQPCWCSTFLPNHWYVLCKLVCFLMHYITAAFQRLEWQWQWVISCTYYMNRLSHQEDGWSVVREKPLFPCQLKNIFVFYSWVVETKQDVFNERWDKIQAKIKVVHAARLLGMNYCFWHCVYCRYFPFHTACQQHDVSLMLSHLEKKKSCCVLKLKSFLCVCECVSGNSSEIGWWNGWQLGLAFCFHSVNQQFISSRFVQKVIVSSRSSLSTYSFLTEPSRQPLLNHGSPLWQRARTAAFTLTSNQINVWSIMGPLPSGQHWIYKNGPLWYLLGAYVLGCVCTQGNRIKSGGPGPLGAFHLVLYVIWQK